MAEQGQDPETRGSGPMIVAVGRLVAAPPERVFDAWLDPTTAGKFLFSTPRGEMIRVEIGARVGGRFLIVERREDGDAAHYGQYVEIDRPHRIAFRLSTEGPDQQGGLVVIDIAPADAGSEVAVAHELKAEAAGMKESVATGWKGVLKRLGEVLE